MRMWVRIWASLCLLIVLSRAQSPASLEFLKKIEKSMVYVDALDASNKLIRRNLGFFVKDGYVATTYSSLSGASEVWVTRPGESSGRKSVGYLVLDSTANLIIISAPGLTSFPSVKILPQVFPDSAAHLFCPYFDDNLVLRCEEAYVTGKQSIGDKVFTAAWSKPHKHWDYVPVFLQDQLAGFCLASLQDEKFMIYTYSAAALAKMVNQGFVIKSFNPKKLSALPVKPPYTEILVQSLTSVIWLDIETAIKLSRENKRKILVDIYTNWNGWSQIMQQNSYSLKSIIRYVNENFYAVRLDAESRETYKIDGRTYGFVDQIRCNQLAYSLLNGKLAYPSTVFLDENTRVLTVIPGYIRPEKLDVILHFIAEKAYLFESYEQYELKYLKD